MAKVRTFVAVEASQSVRDGVSALVNTLRVVDADVKWVAEETLHWTLKFLGEIDELETVHVCRAVTAAVTECAKFDLSVRGLRAFPNVQRPRTIWLGSDDGADQMVALAEVVEHALKPLGFRREARPFEPHLTIGRVRSQHRMRELATELKSHADFDAGASRVAEVVVFSSDLRPAGPVYTAMARGKLTR